MSIEERAESIMLCLNNVCNTGYTLQKCDYDFIDKQIDEIKKEVTDVQPVNEWVSVKNNLPEENVKVLIYTEYNAIAYGFFTGAYYNNRPLFAMTINRNSERSWYEEIRVSHWMPLPEPPKGGDTD